ncbi:hypothetical protein Q5752_001572 [Cryptotrichosporon argae]
MPLFAKRRGSVEAPLPPPTQSRLKGIFSSGAGDTPAKRRLSLSSPSALFKHEKHEHEKTPPMRNSLSGPGEQAAAAPPAPAPIPIAVPTSVIVPENYSLSRSNGDFQPSYPVVADTDDIDYAAISPDGVAASGAGPAAPQPLDENRTRRSVDLARPPSLTQWPALEPRKVSDESTTLSPSQTTANMHMPLTPPSSVPSSSPVSTKPLPADPASPAPTMPSPRRPTLTLATSNLDPPSRPFVAASASASSPSTTTSAPQTPGLAGGRPDMGGRKTSRVIQSPPMPRPIANLPTFVPTASASGPLAWGQLAQGPRTPGWGQLAREGGPKTPGLLSPRTPAAGAWTMPQTPSGARTPGGFPFFTGEPKSKATVTEAEVRRAARVVPALTREPSTIHDEEPLGDDDIVGDDSDSENEAETEGPRPPLTTRLSLLGKGKKRSGSAVAPVSMDVVQEEGDATQTIADRRQVVAPRLEDLRQNTRPMVMGSASTKSVWALPTPGSSRPGTAQHGSWTQFGTDTPQMTPATQYATRTPLATVPGTPTGPARMRTVDSYFATQEGGSGETSEISTPRAPVSAVEGLPNGHDEAVEDSDNDSAESDETSTGSHEPSPPGDAGPRNAARPIALGLAPALGLADDRPALYAQASRSMINLPTPREPPSEPRFSRRNLPKLDAIPSNEQVHSISRPAEIAVADWQKPPPTPAVQKPGFTFGMRRRRSADDLTAKPPGYEPPLPGVYIPRPREEEGRENLPGYSCGVHLEGWLPRKVELNPGKDKPMHRPWKRLYCVIHGTQITFYKFDPHKVPVVARPGEVVPKTHMVTDDEAVENAFVFRATDRFQPPPPPAGGSRRLSDATQPRPRSRSNSTSTATAERRGSADSAGRRGSIDASRRGSATVSTATASSGSGSSRRSSISAALSSATSVGTAHASRSSISSLSAVAEQPAPAPGPTPGSAAPAAADQDKHDLQAFAAAVPAPPRRASVSSAAGGASVQASAAPLVSHLPFQHNTVVDRISLQGGCEAGHAADYKKRPFVLRIRWGDGRQYLVQTDSQRDMIMWLDVLQAGANVAHDLDERVMPKQQQFRRRRRRPPTAANSAAAAGNAAAAANGAVGAAVPDTPEANAAAAAAAAAASAEERRRILIERQRAAEADRLRADHALV